MNNTTQDVLCGQLFRYMDQGVRVIHVDSWVWSDRTTLSSPVTHNSGDNDRLNCQTTIPMLAATYHPSLHLPLAHGKHYKRERLMRIAPILARQVKHTGIIFASVLSLRMYATQRPLYVRQVIVEFNSAPSKRGWW